MNLRKTLVMALATIGLSALVLSGYSKEIKQSDSKQEQSFFMEEQASFDLGTNPKRQVLRNLPYGLEGRIIIEGYDSKKAELALNLKLKDMEKVSGLQECITDDSTALAKSEACYLQKDGNLIQLYWDIEKIKNKRHVILYLE